MSAIVQVPHRAGKIKMTKSETKGPNQRYAVIKGKALFRKSVDFANCDVYHVLVQLLII